MLESYVAGRWFAASDDGARIADAVTGETVVRVSSTGLDVPAMLDHARTVGGPALRELTFHQRAGLLKQLGLRLMADKDEFYALSHRTGATDRDSAVDVDGGFGTVLSYASKAKRELPDDTVVLDGAVEPLGKRGTFAGQHLWTPLRGVAVQINAFNFPVWGFLEKLAPAFLAGVPTIVKPASQTAYLTEAVVRRIVESGLLPEGSVQPRSAAPPGARLPRRPGPCFTGSAATARKLRSTPSVVANSVGSTPRRTRSTAPSSAPTPRRTPRVRAVRRPAGHRDDRQGRPEVHRHPAGLRAPRADGRRRRGHPREAGRGGRRRPGADGVTMGALASVDQRQEVLRAVKALRGVAELVVGDPDDFEVVGADKDRGAFLPPMLLRCDDLDAAEPHDVEAFGPVSTVLPYDGVAHAVELAARGQGSLVGSIVTHDEAVARSSCSAPLTHGRILVLDRDDAKENTGHGSPLPVLVHGGPGRAGGARSWAGSGACCTTCSAPPSRPPTC